MTWNDEIRNDNLRATEYNRQSDTKTIEVGWGMLEDTNGT